uniref:Uncharacterized protein n=1 Tax=Plectus sambesii TaxID=2011161 RepID=A0A914WWN3_9BILA
MLFDDTLRLLKERLKNNAIGCTVIAITGIQSPRRILTLTADLEKTHLDKTFEISELQTVLRGSKCIIDAWKGHFPDNYVHQGHNIIGNPVTWMQCAATEIKQTLYEGLMPFLAQFDGHFNPNEKDTERGIEPRDIAILVDDAVIVQELTKFLNDKWITCGTVEEQANDPLLIAVDHFEQSISYEWPIVFAVGHKSVDADDSYGLVAASRAMALLINVHTECRSAASSAD